VDKATSFGLPFLYRSILPGGVLTALLAPLIDRAIRSLFDPVVALATWAVIVITLGLIAVALDDPIYSVYEGRTLWPGWLYGWRRQRWQKHVDALQKRADALPKDDWRRAELWDRLRRFPLNEKSQWIATRPTKLGNVLSSYEDYPDRVYGLHPVPFWPRLWLLLSKDDRDEIDRSWATTDGWTYTAAAVLFAGIAYLALAAIAAVGTAYELRIVLTPDEQIAAAYAGGALVLASVVPYWISLPGHARNGDMLMAMFDVYRTRLRGIEVPVGDAEQTEATRVGEWLTYGYGRRAPTPVSGGWRARLRRQLSGSRKS
jgi:hypothetical protein